jgi:hypothetical protein
VDGNLDVASLAQLPALQTLKGDLCAAGPPPPGGWEASAQLRLLQPAYEHSVKVLSRLRAPRAMVLSPGDDLDGVLWLRVDPELLTADGSALLAEGEVALRRALRFLGHHGFAGEAVGILAGAFGAFDEGTVVGKGVLPVGGPDGVGPGRRNHAWLAGLAALAGELDVELEGWDLSAQDVQALSRLDNMRELRLERCRVVPLPALAALGRARSLQQLNLDSRMCVTGLVRHL